MESMDPGRSKTGLRMFLRCLLSILKNGTVQIETQKTRFSSKLMKLQTHIDFFPFTLRTNQRYEMSSKFNELFENQHHLSESLN